MSIRIDDREFEKFVEKDTQMELVKKKGFSNYFMMSRVLYPLNIRPSEPQFASETNQNARLIQESLDLEPGLGSNVLWVFDKVLSEN